MRYCALLVSVFLSANMVLAQDDPVVMRIAGNPIYLSEFEYAYHKNYSPEERGRKHLEDFAERYLDYKLKIQAARDAHLDTLPSLRKGFGSYWDKQVTYPFARDSQAEEETRRIYENTRHKVEANGGLVKAAQILLALRQDATESQRRAQEQRADSIYHALKAGANFSAMARKYSDDSKSARAGGEMPWVAKGQTVKSFEDVVFAMKEGEISRPFLSEFGYHIILLKEKRPFRPYESHREELHRQVKMQDLKEAALNSIYDAPEILPVDASPTADMEPRSSHGAELRESHLSREFRDGILLYEMTKRTIWQKAENDEKALASYYKRHKKDYRWEHPRFKGVAFYVRNYNDVKKAQQVLKNKPASQWKSILNRTFNNDSIEGIKVEEGLFLPGDHPLVDRDIFKKGVRPSPYLGFHVGATYGELLKKGPKAYTDVRELVLADYLEYLEREWTLSLRKRYQTVIDQSVLTIIK